MFEMFKRKPSVKMKTEVSKDGELLEREYLTDQGEYPDPTPIAPPIGYKKQPSMVQIVREQIRAAHLARDLEAAGAETFEEADDFEVDDPEGDMAASPHENDFDPPVSELLKEGAKAKQDREEGEKLAKRKAELEAEEAAEREYKRKRRERESK